MQAASLEILKKVFPADLDFLWRNVLLFTSVAILLESREVLLTNKELLF